MTWTYLPAWGLLLRITARTHARTHARPLWPLVRCLVFRHRASHKQNTHRLPLYSGPVPRCASHRTKLGSACMRITNTHHSQVLARRIALRFHLCCCETVRHTDGAQQCRTTLCSSPTRSPSCACPALAGDETQHAVVGCHRRRRRQRCRRRWDDTLPTGWCQLRVALLLCAAALLPPHPGWEAAEGCALLCSASCAAAATWRE